MAAELGQLVTGRRELEHRGAKLCDVRRGRLSLDSGTIADNGSEHHPFSLCIGSTNCEEEMPMIQDPGLTTQVEMARHLAIDETCRGVESGHAVERSGRRVGAV